MIKAGEAKRKAGDFAAAALLYRRAAENRQQYFGKYDATALDAYRTAGSLQTMAKDYAGAEKSYRAALAISSLNHGLGSFESIPTLTSLAGSLKMQNRTGEAIGILRQVLVLQERQAGLDSDLAAATRSEVADMCLKVGDYNNGEALFKQTAEIAESKGQTDKCITALQSYANVLQQTLKLKEAEQVMQKINAIKGSASSPEATTKLSPTNDPNSAVRSNQNTAPSRQMRSSLPENPNAVQTTSVTSGAGYASSAATASSSK
jgi:tetratricopeptide (TPR) repeat protein